jgi:predicted  nucleic acid-binding Zn-ribbon protein
MDERFDRLTTTVDAHTELLGDLKQTQDRIIAKVVVMDETLTIVQNDVSGLKKDVSRLNDSVDGFAKRQLKFESEVAATHSRLDRLERKPEPA